MPLLATALPLLYSYRRCPYAMRARLALLVAGQRFMVWEVVLRDKPPEMLALSPKGTVPVLCLPDGRVLDESWDIMAWAFRQRDAQGWWLRAQTPDNLDLLRRNDGEFKRWLDRYKYPERHPDGWLAPEACFAGALEALLGPLEARLQQAPHLGGATPCATDVAVFPFVRQFAAVDPARFARQAGPALQAWLAGWLASGLMAVCMSKLPSQAASAFPAWPESGP